MHTCSSKPCGAAILPGQRRRTGPEGQTLCNPCYCRWHKAGRPTEVPPPPAISTGQARGRQRKAASDAAALDAQALAALYSPREIAERMGLTLPTVRGYLQRTVTP